MITLSFQVNFHIGLIQASPNKDRIRLILNKEEDFFDQ